MDRMDECGRVAEAGAGMNALHALHFLRPGWLWLLLLLPVMPWMLRRTSAQGNLARLVDARLMPLLVEGKGRGRQLGLAIAVMLAWVLACLALAGPTWARMPQPEYASRSAQVIAVSMSRRMLAQDLTPDRLTRVRYKIHALLQANRAGQNGLVAYAGAAFTVAPLTTDADALTELVDALAPDTMPVQGDDAAAGIRRAERLIHGAGLHQGSIVVIDDHADQRALAAAREARAAGMRVSVLGVGTDKGAPVPSAQGGFEQADNGRTLMARRDDASLRALADAGGGSFVAITPGHGDIQALARQLRQGAGVRDTQHAATAWRDGGAWLLLPLLVLVALGFRKGVLLFLPWVVLPLIAPMAHASGWTDAWRTRDQQAAQALAAGHPKRAQQLARDPALRGTAAYRAGDYRAAARAFARAPGAYNLYNRGNALARMHRYKEAIKAYDRALKADPGLADARINRKAVRDWLHRHKPPPHQGSGGARGKTGGQPGQDKSTSNASGRHHADAGHKGPQHTSRNEGRNGQGAQRDRKGRNGGNAAQNHRQASSGGGNRKQDKSGGSGNDDHATRAQTKADHQAQARAQQALKRKLQQQLGAPKEYALGLKDKHAGKRTSLPPDMQQALQQVPDDPGGLLRNKFMLEYQRRLQRGDGTAQPDPDGGP